MKSFKFLAVLFVSFLVIMLPGCGKRDNPKTESTGQTTVHNNASGKTGNGNTFTDQPDPGIDNSKVKPIDNSKVKPDEDGKIMAVMFHNFIETFKSGDKEYTMTFGQFRKLLQTLYDKGYRLIGLTDYLNNDIKVPAGCIPMLFTFDDGTSGQFNLVEENGRLAANKNSAVGIMEEFNRIHPDFGLKGIFYVNLGDMTFTGKGSMAERLKYLIDKGFEIGNHTLNHVHLNEIKSADKIKQEIGGNQKRMYELIPGYKMESFSLPYGQPSKELQEFVVKGVYEGVGYENFAIMKVGWNPAVSPASKKFNPLSTSRVRAPGIKPVEGDLMWWLEKLSRDEQYVSDGNPGTITIPKEKKEDIDENRLKGKKLITY